MRSLSARPAAVSAAVGDEAPIGQAGGRRVPLRRRSSPGPAAGDSRVTGAGRGQQHVDLAAVEAGLDQRGDVAVAAVLAQHGAAPARAADGGAAAPRPTTRPRPGAGRRSGRRRRPGRPARPARPAPAPSTASPSTRRSTRSTAASRVAEHRLGRGERPGVGQGPGHHRRREVEERGGHHRRARPGPSARPGRRSSSSRSP